MLLRLGSVTMQDHSLQLLNTAYMKLTIQDKKSCLSNIYTLSFQKCPASTGYCARLSSFVRNDAGTTFRYDSSIGSSLSKFVSLFF